MDLQGQIHLFLSPRILEAKPPRPVVKDNITGPPVMPLIITEIQSLKRGIEVSFKQLNQAGAYRVFYKKN
jgi:hypothetical protein